MPSTKTTKTRSYNPYRRQKAHGKPRKVTFQHIRTERTITAPSVAAFARKARLGYMGRYHFDDILKGKRLHCKGWGLPKVLNQSLHLKDVWGNEVKATVAELTPKLSTTAINRLRAGRPVGPIAPASHDFGAAIPPRDYRITGYAVRQGNSGRIYRGNTLLEVAEQVGLSRGPIWALVHGMAAQTKSGIRLHQVTTKQRKPFVPVC